MAGRGHCADDVSASIVFFGFSVEGCGALRIRCNSAYLRLMLVAFDVEARLGILIARMSGAGDAMNCE